jgi:hypothetical protein
MDDMDDFVKLLIAVGDIGRDNIESVELAWQSRTDSECQWTEVPVPNEHSFNNTCPSCRKVCPAAQAMQETPILASLFRERPHFGHVPRRLQS